MLQKGRHSIELLLLIITLQVGCMLIKPSGKINSPVLTNECCNGFIQPGTAIQLTGCRMERKAR